MCMPGKRLIERASERETCQKRESFRFGNYYHVQNTRDVFVHSGLSLTDDLSCRSMMSMPSSYTEDISSRSSRLEATLSCVALLWEATAVAQVNQ